jgi:hypothetical protein
MRRILPLLTVGAVIGAMMATSGTPASAQSPCPPTGPSNGPATLLTPDVPRGAGFVCLDEVEQRFFCPPGFEHWLFRNPPGSRPPFQAECVELALASNGGEGGAEPTQSGEQAESAPPESVPAESVTAESAPAESAPAESTPAESTPAESAAPATTAGSIGDSVLEAYDSHRVARRMLGVGILALTLIVALLMAWRLPKRRNVEDVVPEDAVPHATPTRDQTDEPQPQPQPQLQPPPPVPDPHKEK